MANKIISTLTKSLAAKIVWIGGAAAGMTALFSALGFLVLKGHQDLLGISGLVPTKPESWTIEGAKFAYSSVYLLFSGCLNRPGILAWALAIAVLLGLVSATKWLEKLQKYTATIAGQAILVVITLALLIGGLAVMVPELLTSHLLLDPSIDTFQQEILPRTTGEGLQNLAFQYAVYAMFAVFLALWLKVLPHFLFSPPAEAKSKPESASEEPVWIKVLPQLSTDKAEGEFSAASEEPLWLKVLPRLFSSPPEKAEGDTAAPGRPLWLHGLWGIFLIHLLLLPILYGQLVKGHEYFKVCLRPDFEVPGASASACGGEEGWLLYKGGEELVVYMPKSAAKLQVLKQKEFKQIQVLAYGNLMETVPSPTTAAAPNPAASPPGSAVAEMAQFLRNVPASLAAGIKPLTRTLQTAQKTLVLANNTGQTIDTFDPFDENQKGAIRSPIFLPDERGILYVEVLDNSPRLKVVANDLQRESLRDFGEPAVEGWEPQIGPDGRFIIFRQGRTKLVRVDIEGKNPTVLLEDQALNKLLGVFPGDDEQSWWLVYSKYQENVMSYWTAEIRGDDVAEQRLDGEDWKLVGSVRVHQGRLLYEQEDVMALVMRDDELVLAADEENTERAGTQAQKIFNVYLSDSPGVEGKRISNVYPGAIPNHNRYPAWSRDGSMMVYVSGDM